MADLGSHLWGKAGGNGDDFHPLVCHLVDVGVVADALLTEGLPRAIVDRLRAFGEPATISAWCALHDLGKASPAFQAKQPVLAAAVEKDGLAVGHPRNPDRAPHGLVTRWTLPDLLAGRCDSGGASDRIADVVAAHHGLFPTTAQVLSRRDNLAGTGGWVDARRELVHRVFEVFGAPPSKVLLSVTDAVLMAGLCTVADWIGSNRAWFPYTADGAEDLAGYADRARSAAGTVRQALGWTPWAAAERSFIETFSAEPRPLQREVEKLAEELEGQALVLIEAPMGEGKTEAALLAAERLAARVGYGGVYLALPTQATANQMFGRLSAFLSTRRQGSSEAERDGPVVQLLHGSAWMLRDEHHGLASRAMELEGIYDDAQADVVASEWFTRRKRGLLAPFGVGTVDQVLLAGIRAKHVFVRLFGLAGKVVIIDEAHAYDTYMSRILDRTVQWLGALGASVIVLSATLPARRRSELVSAFAGGMGKLPADVESEDERGVAYPLVTSVDRRGVARRAANALRHQHVGLIEQPWGLDEPGGPAALAAELVEATEGGGCVVAICNTVVASQRVFDAVDAALDGDPDVRTRVVHSRFCAEDRARWEADLQRWFGPPPSPERPRRSIIVATQVVEQSLDVDFDLLVSELAPIDLLLQRIGRLHRHERKRPPRWQKPTCWWFGPPLDPRGRPRLVGWPSSAVYEPHVLLRSWLVARDHRTLTLPDDIRELVEAVYGHETLHSPADLEPLWEETLLRMEQTLAEATSEATTRFLPPPTADLHLADLTLDPSREDDDAHRDVQALTRLGPPSMTVVCLWGLDGPASITKDGTTPVALNRVPTQAEARALLTRSMTLSLSPGRRALRELLQDETPHEWRHSPWLRSAHLLRLDPTGAKREVGGMHVALDDRKGLIIGRVER